MSAFNELICETECPHCGATGPFSVQFKYGDTWQDRYVPGEILRWGGNDIGTPGHRKVVLSGIGSEPCESCGTEFVDFFITLESDRLVEVKGLKEEDPALEKEDFVVVEE